MGEVPTEVAISAIRTIPDPEGFSSYLRQYDAFLEVTTQMLVTPKLQERLQLALEAVTNILGYKQAALAVINERDAVLRVRAVRGFDSEQALTRIEMPLDSSAACVRVIHDAHPIWISLRDDEASRALFDRMHWQQDVLALPLFGIPEMSGRREAIGLRVYDDYWTYEPGSRLGVLYVASPHALLEGPRLTILRRFADRVGVVASLAMQQDRLTSSVTKLQSEPQWIE